MLPSLQLLSVNEREVLETATTFDQKRKAEEPALSEREKLQRATQDRPLSEYDASDGWNNEYAIDLERLKRLLEGAHKAERDEARLQNARMTEEMVKPAPTSLRQQEVRSRRAIKFMGMDIDTFLECDRLLSEICKNDDYFYWAMPVNPTQGQYKPVEDISRCCGVVVNAKHEELVKRHETLRKLLNNRYIKLLHDWASKTTKLMKTVEEKHYHSDKKMEGGFNLGKRIMPHTGYDKWFFEHVNSKECNIQKIMADRTGLWYRTSRPTRQTATYAALQIESYYTLVAAMQSVGLPVYALRMKPAAEPAAEPAAKSTTSVTAASKSAMNGRLSVISEMAMGDLYDNVVPESSYGKDTARCLYDFIGSRFSACTLQLAETGYCLSDGKPENFLFQRNYAPLKLDGDRSVTDFPACIVATDIDPQFSVLADVAVPQTLESYMIDSECVRFANLCVFSIAAGCTGWFDGEGNVDDMPHGFSIMESALVPLKRYANLDKSDDGSAYQGAFVCRHFFDPQFTHNGDSLKVLNLRNRYHAEEWTWTTFWSALAQEFIKQTRNYGLDNIENSNPPCVGLFRELHGVNYTDGNVPFGKRVALLAEWFVEKRRQRASRS